MIYRKLCSSNPTDVHTQEKRFDITESTSLQEFADFLKKDSRTAQYDQDTAAVLFDKVMLFSLVA